MGTMWLRYTHLGCYSPLALKLGFVAVKGLLSAILEVIASVMFWKTMLWGRSVRMFHIEIVKVTDCSTKFGSTVGTLANDANNGRVARGLTLKLTSLLSGHWE